MGQTPAQMIGQRGAITEERATRRTTGVAELETEARGIADLAREQETARTAARPATPDLTPAPSTKARAFLEPGASVLGQVQTVMQGIGQIAMGMAGGKGTGYAIAATAALKGAAEGWQQGDAERVRRSLAEWQTQHTHLMDKYQIERDQFNDLLTNQKLSMSERFAQIRLRAEIMGMHDLADAARQEHIDRVFTILHTLDDSQIKHERAAADLLRYKSEAEARLIGQQQAAERLRLSTEAGGRARESSSRSAEQHRIMLATAKPFQEVQGKYLAVTNQLENYDSVIRAIAVADRAGLLAQGPAAPDQWRTWFARQGAYGDPEVGKAVNLIERQGVALLAAADIELGEKASQMRLKVISEPQLAHPMASTRGFWDEVLPRIKRNLEHKRESYADTMKRLAPLFQRDLAPPEAPMREVTEP